MPTANVEAYGGSEGSIGKVWTRRAFRGLRIGSRPRRPPSACSDITVQMPPVDSLSMAKRCVACGISPPAMAVPGKSRNTGTTSSRPVGMPSLAVWRGLRMPARSARATIFFFRSMPTAKTGSYNGCKGSIGEVSTRRICRYVPSDRPRPSACSEVFVKKKSALARL